MKTSSLFRLVALTFLLAFAGRALHAADLGAVKSRMEQRLGSIDALKDRHVAGENNRGFLEARGSAAAGDQKIISDENADRTAVYAAIAAQQKTSAEQVGRARAEQLASRSKSGVWVQSGSGEWRQKS